jgi:MFS transporter, PPP family, 3-phenylpropionic acid transporter
MFTRSSAALTLSAVQPGRNKIQLKSSSPFTFYFLLFGAYAFVLPFLVLYYQEAGFTGTQIGLLSGITPLVTMLGTSLWTALADAKRQHRLIMSLALLIGAFTLFAFPFFTTFIPVLLFAVLFFAFFAPLSSLADNSTMHMLGDKKEMYGRIRLGGTIGFGIAVTLAGILVQRYGLSLAFWGGGVLLLLALVISQNFVHSTQLLKESARHGIRTLLANRHWLLFLMLAFAGGLGLAGTNTYLFPYMKELGANETTMGLAMTIGTIAEMPVLFFGNLLLQRFKPFRLLILAIFFTGLRLLALAASGTPTLVLVAQILNGLTFPPMWIAGVAYAYENAPTGLGATAQGMFGAMVFGFGAAAGGFAGGPLLENIGGRGLYIVFGLAVFGIVGLAILLQRVLPKEVRLPASLVK